MGSPEDDSSIEFTSSLEKLGKYLDQYLDQYDPPQCVLDRMEELNKEVDNTTDKALKEYRRIHERTRAVSLKLTLSEYDLLKAEADKELLKTIAEIRRTAVEMRCCAVEIRSRAAEMRWLAAKMRYFVAYHKSMGICKVSLAATGL